MNDEFSSNDFENDDFILNNEESDYINLVTRLNNISEMIALLEKTIFK